MIEVSRHIADPVRALIMLAICIVVGIYLVRAKRTMERVILLIAMQAMEVLTLVFALQTVGVSDRVVNGFFFEDLIVTPLLVIGATVSFYQTGSAERGERIRQKLRFFGTVCLIGFAAIVLIVVLAKIGILH